MERFSEVDAPIAAVVVGASGGIGGAFVRDLVGRPGIARVHALSRRGAVPAGPGVVPGRIDLGDEASVMAAARTVMEAEAEAGNPDGPRLLLIASGILHDPADGFGPEKSWRHLSAAGLARSFAINATGPALVARAFLEHLPRRGPMILAALSARVGSISDNRAGGWHGYRASKAALNQILRCIAIEEARRRPGLVVAGLQPGTVRTGLSEPFRGAVAEEEVFAPGDAAANLLGVLDRLTPAQSGRVFDWRGDEVPP